MRYPETFAVHFARVLDFFAAGRSKDDQKAEFRSVLGLLDKDAVVLEDGGDVIIVNGSPFKFPSLDRMLEQLRAQRVVKVTLEPGVHPAHLFSLLQALAGVTPSGVVEHLKETESSTVMVELGDAPAQEVPEEAVEDGSAEAPQVDLLRDLPLVDRTLPKIRETIESLTRDPNGNDVPRLLQLLVMEVEAAVKDQWVPQALVAAQTVVRLSGRSTRDDARIAHMKAQRVILSPQMLEAYARVAADPDVRPAVVELFRAAGSHGTDLLVELLERGETKSERLGYMHVMAQLREGMDRVLTMLTHPKWYVVRNGAELCGELRLSHAVSNLVRLIEHADRRVRRAVGYALGRIATLESAEHFRRILKDREPDVRRHAIAGLQGTSASPMVGLLATLLDKDSHVDVRREILYAFGRIGTADAVEALVRAAAPGGKVFNRKPVKVRVAAAEALGLVKSSVAAIALMQLIEDDNDEVRSAARRASARNVRDNSWAPSDADAPRLSTTSLQLNELQ